MALSGEFKTWKSRRPALDVATVVLLIVAVLSVLLYTVATYNSSMRAASSEIYASQFGRVYETRVELQQAVVEARQRTELLAYAVEAKLRLLKHPTGSDSEVAALSRSSLLRPSEAASQVLVPVALGVLAPPATTPYIAPVGLSAASFQPLVAKGLAKLAAGKGQLFAEIEVQDNAAAASPEDSGLYVVSGVKMPMGQRSLVVIWRLPYPAGESNPNASNYGLQISEGKGKPVSLEFPHMPRLIDMAEERLKQQLTEGAGGFLRADSAPGAPAMSCEVAGYLISAVPTRIEKQRFTILVATPRSYLGAATAGARSQALLITLVLLVAMGSLAATLIKTRRESGLNKEDAIQAGFDAKVNQLSSELLDSATEEELAKVFSKAALQLSRATGAALWRPVDKGWERFGEASGPLKKVSLEATGGPGSPFSLAAKSRQPVVLDELQSASWGLAEAWVEAGIRSLVVLPMSDADNPEDILAVAVVASGEPFTFSEHEIYYHLYQLLLPALQSSLRRLKERQRADLASRWLASVLDEAGSGMCVLSQALTIQLWNGKAEQLLGLPASEVLGKQITSLPQLADSPCIAKVRELAAGKVASVYGLCEIQQEGSTQWLQYSGSTTLGGNGEVAVLLSFSDVTELRKAQEEASGAHAFLARVLENSQAAIAVYNKDKTIRSQNSYVEQLADKALTEPGEAATVGEAMAELASRVLLVGQPVREGQLGFLDGKGGKRQLTLSASPLAAEDGSLEGVVLVGTDVTELYTLRERLAAGEKTRIIAELAAGVAHDFNNVLAAIMGNAELALEIDDPKLRKEWLESIVGSAEEGAASVRRLQEFANIRKDVDLQRVPVRELFSTVLELTEPRWLDEAERRGITIHPVLELEEPLPDLVGDESSLQQLFVSLVLNAVEAMPAGGELRLSARVEGREIRLSVADTGLGMAPEVLQHCREAFYSTKGRTGLGLSVSHGIAKRHGGRLQVASKLGEGTTITIGLPVEDDTRPEPQQRATFEQLVDDAPAQGTKTGKLLVVEDLPEVRRVLTTLLARLGHQVNEFGDPLVALEWAREGDFDLVITDLGMPGISGLDLASELHRMRPDLPIILATGWGEQVDKNHAALVGITEVLAKPYRQHELIRLLDKHLPD